MFPRVSKFSLLECNAFVWLSRRASAAGVEYPRQLVALVSAIGAVCFLTWRNLECVAFVSFMSRRLLERGTGIVQTCSGCTQRNSVVFTGGMCGPFRPVLTAQGIGDQI